MSTFIEPVANNQYFRRYVMITKQQTQEMQAACSQHSAFLSSVSINLVCQIEVKIQCQFMFVLSASISRQLFLFLLHKLRFHKVPRKSGQGCFNLGEFILVAFQCSTSTLDHSFGALLILRPTILLIRLPFVQWVGCSIGTIQLKLDGSCVYFTKKISKIRTWKQS